jgi:acyl transferase domain-containing protein/acyl-CoA synthetase (AMP-forming)/AMP-acid ligase II/acyl carrier protein
MQTHATIGRGFPGSGFGETLTLAEALRATVACGTGGVIYVRADGMELRQSYAELLGEAERIASGLCRHGVQEGDHVLLQLEAGQDYIPGLWGCVLAGAVAVPVAVAPTFSHVNSALQKLLNAGKLLEHAPVLASGAAVEGLRRLPANLGALAGAVLDLGELRRGPADRSLPQRQAEDVAVLLLTSGSTGQPKGVPLTHRNLLAMAAGTIEDNGFTSAEVTLNWMALDHAGSVSFLGTMATALGCTQIHVPTGYILQEPLRWLDLIARHRATISWAPNFAFTLFLDRAAAVEAGTWDLGSMRFLVNAGEPVVARTARKFLTLLQRHGLPVGALRPAFGMSETCSGITWSRGLTLDNTGDDQAFVDLGPAIPGAEMRVVSESGAELPEGENGMLQFRGPSVFAGYYRNPDENARVFKDGWFETGDLAFLKNGCLHIAGRLKDVIIINGANFYCHEIESAAESVPGLIKTYTAACAVRDATAQTDQLALFFCLEPDQRADLDTITRSLRTSLFQQVGVAPAYLVPVEISEVPKTEIGKIQRAQLKKSFEAGAYRDRAIQATRSNAAKVVRKRAKTRGELATAIAELWQEVLGLDRVGHDETFFELGGHSLLIVQVQVRLQELVGRAVPVVELFNCPTVRTMADHFAKEFEAVDRSAGATAASVERTTGQSGDIAIVGIGLRFPGASNPEEFWRVLAEGREMITFFTAEQSLAAGVDAELVRNPNHVRAAPLLDAPEAFDAEFFRYSAKEARMIDPQQRVFLEVCWEAFEDAGYDPLTFPGKVGLFAASGMNSYLPNNLWANDTFLREENGGRMLTVDSMNGFNVMITNDKDYLPMRVSYKLNLRGPSVNVQSACSSTLLTLHEACKSLRMGDCEMALAGGASIKLPQHAGHLYSPGMLNSPDGHCRAYDEKAEGTIFGNGAGVVLLKPLAAAQAAGDRIYAVVKGTASNNDGGSKVGFTAPSSAGQEDVCAEAMARAGVSPNSVTFMEGHGTGTALGDPIEVNALTSAFRRHTGRSGFCALGSVKTNVGHLQIASGIAGLIKATLALHHRQIPGTLHFEKPNPRIDFATTPFFVNRQTVDWVSPDGPRRAGVNSLGIGGTNVHAILEEAPVPASMSGQRSSGPWVVPISARNHSALRQLVTRYADRIARKESGNPEDIAFTAQVGRAAMPARVAFVADSRDDLVRQLAAFAADKGEPAEQIDFDQRGVAFHFSGTAAGVAEQARQLWVSEPVFRQAAETCLGCLDEISATPTVRLADETKVPAGFASANRAVTGVFLFVFEFALAELLASYGIKPTAVSGDGVGEIVAASRAGGFSVEDALRLMMARERLLSGARQKNDEAAFSRAVAQIEFSPPSRRLASGVNGQWVEAELATAEYWVRHANTAGQAHVARAALVADGYKVVVDIGGMDTTAGDVPHHFAAGDFTRLLATLFTLGYPVQWRQGRQSRPARRVTLPTYPWQHQRYWIDAVNLRAPQSAIAATPANPLLGRRWRSPRVKSCIYETRFDPAAISYLAEHHVHGAIVTPGALYLAQVALQAADFLPASATSNGGVRLSDVVFVSAMAIDPLHPRIVQTVFTPEDGGGHGFEVISWTEAAPDNVVVHATGHCQVERIDTATLEIAQLRAGLQPVADIAGRHYAIMDRMEVRLGPSFRWISELHRGERQSLLRLDAPAGLEQVREWHPGLVDSFLQATVAALGLDGARTLIPFRMGRVCFHRNPDGGSLYAHAQQIAAADPTISRADVRLYDADGRLMAEALGFELRHLQARDVEIAAVLAATPKYFETILEPLTAPTSPSRNGGANAWLFLSEGDAATRALQRALQAAGATIREIPVARASEAEALLATHRWTGVVHAWNLPVTQPSALRWRELLACIKAAASRPEAPARWVFLTASGTNALAQSPLGGFVTGLAHEHPDWRPLHLEIDVAETAMERWVPWMLDTASSERRLALCAGVVCGQRLVEKTVAATSKPIRADGSYLITGAGGALGQAVAEWLVGQGARLLYLAGRRVASQELQAKIAIWERRGVSAHFAVTDMGDAQSVRALVARASAAKPLRGVFHAAGALRDGLLRQTDVDAFTSVFGAKIGGAGELHSATKDQPLDCFVLFSSIASLLGSAGQANYAAGNAFMDALAVERQAAGLPGLSIQWGPWDGIGMTARLGVRDRERLQERGLLAMAPADALRALGQVSGLSGCVGVFAWNRGAYRTAFNGRLPAFYHRILSTDTPPPATPAADRSYATLPTTERAEAIERLIRLTVAKLLGFDSYLKVERDKGLFDLGIDSLTAIDLKNRLEKSLGHALRSTIAFDYPTASEMAAHLAETLFPATKPPPASAPAAANRTEAEDLSGLSASDLEALLEKELKG